MNLQKMMDLRKITRDPSVPMATRMAANSKYKAGLELAAKEFDDHLGAIRAKLNESRSLS